MAYPGHPCRGCAIPWNGGITVWQNTRVAILFDLSYLLDTAWRFAVGQVPYRDLPFSHAPLTFLLHAAVITLFGWVYYPHVVLGAIEAGAATVLTWRLLLRTGWGSRWGWAMVLTSPLVVLGIRDYPHPDLRQRGYTRGANRDMAAAQSRSGRFASGGSSRGATCVVPLFFKQKIGLAFLGGVAVSGSCGRGRMAPT